MARLNKKGCMKAGVYVVLSLNVAVAGFVIHNVLRTSNQLPDIMRHMDFKLPLDVAMKYQLPTSSKLHNHDGDDNTAPPSLEFLNLLKPIAHLSGLQDIEDDCKGDKNGNVSVRNWTTAAVSDETYLHNGMDYEYGSIVVQVAGVYHISSHVKFFVGINKKDDNSSQTIHHQIVRYSASSRKQVVLFENVVTECRESINDGAHFEYPSLTGGLAQLDAWDQVIVRVSHYDLLKLYRNWQYFDMYLI